MPNGHDCVAALQQLYNRLHRTEPYFKSVPCVSTRIELGLARLDLCPMGYTCHSTTLRDLGHAFDSRYSQEGNIADLNRAIEVEQARLDLCPLDHPEHASALGELAVSFWKYYCIQKNEADLDKLIDMEQKWLDLSLPSHADYERALGELALSLWNRYDAQQDMEDLNRSIDMGEQRLALCPAGHPHHDTALNNLALSIRARYQKQGNLTDLNQAIKLQEQFLVLHPPSFPKHGLALRNLALSLQDHYYEVEDYSDLIKAIQLFTDAMATFPVQHSDFAFIAGQLAATILMSLESSNPGQPPPSLDEAFEAYSQLKKCSPAVSLDLWEATLDWIHDAEKYNHYSVLEAYQTALNTLDHFTSLDSSLDSRHETMQARVADLVNDAFSCSTRHESSQVAVELLEQGRGILWNQLARFDISVAALESQSYEGRELGKRFMRLSTDLRKHAQGSGGQDTNPYWRVQEEWQSVVDRIRCLDGFSRFLLPPRFDDLQQAAEHGPVIVVNASIYSCDAVIVLCSGPPVHVSLPCSFDDVFQLCLQLSEVTQDSHAYGTNRESWVKQMLRELWSSVVESIVTVLQDDIQLPLGSRIWWCPTSKLTNLPFHAAGPYRKAEKNLMDIYVSSYAPSLSALIRTRDRMRSQKIGRDASGIKNSVSFAAVGQARPSADTKLGELPEVEHEIRKIRDEVGMPPEVTFDVVTGNAATIEGAIEAFRHHRWVHVACHGAQHAEKPFESWFAMRDGKLTLMRIIQERYTNSEFAFLSACHTAVGDESTPDEVLHLAAGMQFAGFNGVIGTLWKVDDAEAHRVVTRFYREMFKRPVVDFEHAAAALNTAVLESADEVALEKRIVFVHIGI